MSDIFYYLIAREVGQYGQGVPVFEYYRAIGDPTLRANMALRWNEQEPAIAMAEIMGNGWFAARVRFNGDARAGA